MANEGIGMVTRVRKMTCVKWDGDAPRATWVRRWLRKIGFSVPDAPFKMPAEIIVVIDGQATRRVFPREQGLTKADVLRLLDPHILD